MFNIYLFYYLVGLSNGWIQEMPRVFLDPRRPVVAAATPEMREEGIFSFDILLLFITVLPLQPFSIKVSCLICPNCPSRLKPSSITIRQFST
jgi:hypothetical protein